MALNVKKRKERVLKSDQMIEESLLNGSSMPETSSDAILNELNKELDKDTKVQENTSVEDASFVEEKKQPGKVGRKKTYENDRFLIHVRVDEELKDKIDSAVFARKQTMQDYIMTLIMDDMNKNGSKYKTVYDSMMEFQRSLV